MFPGKLLFPEREQQVSSEEEKAGKAIGRA